jgi:alcohol dehydrogenase class IV
MEAREAMSWADTIGGLAIASAGVTLPHGIGMQIGGHCPQVAHGASLAALYPSFTRFTWDNAIEDFAKVGRIFNPALTRCSDRDAAKASCEAIDDFLKRIDLWIDLKYLGVERDKLRSIADDGQVLPDYKNNPRIATINEMYELLIASYDRTES